MGTSFTPLTAPFNCQKPVPLTKVGALTKTPRSNPPLPRKATAECSWCMAPLVRADVGAIRRRLALRASDPPISTLSVSKSGPCNSLAARRALPEGAPSLSFSHVKTLRVSNARLHAAVSGAVPPACVPIPHQPEEMSPISFATPTQVGPFLAESDQYPRYLRPPNQRRKTAVQFASPEVRHPMNPSPVCVSSPPGILTPRGRRSRPKTSRITPGSSPGVHV